jgi:hypothetical protein
VHPGAALRLCQGVELRHAAGADAVGSHLERQAGRVV